MKKNSVKKVLKYKPPIFISLITIVLFFFLFLYISINHKSYAIETKIDFPDTISLNTLPSAKSETLMVYKSYSDEYQNFSLNNNGNYANEYIKDKKIEDSGLIYLLSNNYPNKSLLDENGNSIDEAFQTWITQTSIWLYLYEQELLSNGTVSDNSPNYLDNNTINQIKSSKKLIYNDKEFKVEDTIYNKYIKQTIDNALMIRNSKQEIDLNYFKEDKIYSTKNNKYYQTSAIKIITNSSEKFKNYKINLDKAPKGTKLVDADGKVINKDTLLSATDEFYIRVLKKYNLKNININIKVIGVFDDYEGYEYKQEGYKNIVVSHKIDKEITKNFEIKF
ncbi:MAG: hypothetical protein IJF92_03510 [Bacilli bacterium]|nr:hypothetical protein [Bacilli bacterium]